MKGEGTGTGLGLASLHGFVEQAGGRVHLESALGSGTCLSFCLPLSTAPLSHSAGKARISRYVGGSETILLVEDEPAIRGMVTEVLRNQGYKVVAASDGLDALEQVEKMVDPLDLLLTDVVMPRLGGLDLARRLRSVFPDLHVILTSGYVHGGIGELSEFGTDVRAIAKPYTPGELLAGVREMLDSDSDSEGRGAG